MLGKSSKLELGFVNYIAKFTILRFLISRFECIDEIHISLLYHPSRHGELFAEGADQQGSTSSKDLLAAQLGIWTFGIIAL